ncbi:MAG: hypothetical protein JO052_28945 [Bradyrhizobium sp.]|nr:hypothetical protein [Bradyrhizobium sp.]
MIGEARGHGTPQHPRNTSDPRLPASASFRHIAQAACFALALMAESAATALPAGADEQSQADLSRFTIRETVNSLPAAPVVTGAAAASRANLSETEIDYRVTDWYQLALAASASLSGGADGSPAWNGIRLSNTVLMPDAGARTVFFGLTAHLAYTAPGAEFPPLAMTNTRFAVGLAPIVGFNYQAYQLILSPTVVTGIGANTITSLAAAARLTRSFGGGFDVGVEYSGVPGQIGNFGPLNQQSHIVYAITDFKVADSVVNLGLGYGLTAASRGIAAKIAISHGF